MEELAKVIAAETGISAEQAEQAANVAIKFMKDKLPASISGQLDTALDNPNLADQASNILKMGKGLLGGKK